MGDDTAVPALTLGLQQSRVRTLIDVVVFFARLMGGDTNADPGLDFYLIKKHPNGAHIVKQTIGHQPRSHLISTVKNRQKLLTAPACTGVSITNAGLEGASQLNQHLIAKIMAIGVVDDLEGTSKNNQYSETLPVKSSA